MLSKILRSEKMCVDQKSNQRSKKLTFFSINTIVNYIYYLEENINNAIKIYYFYFINYIKITVLFLLNFSNKRSTTFKPKIQVKVVLSNVSRWT